MKQKLDCVSYESSSYIALVDNTGIPVTNTSVWMYLAVGTESDVACSYLNLTMGTTPGKVLSIVMRKLNSVTYEVG